MSSRDTKTKIFVELFGLLNHVFFSKITDGKLYVGEFNGTWRPRLEYFGLLLPIVLTLVMAYVYCTFIHVI